MHRESAAERRRRFLREQQASLDALARCPDPAGELRRLIARLEQEARDEAPRHRLGRRPGPSPLRAA